jgi:hypothetical protein
MNLALHHFRKEFSFLRMRWFAFLALLFFDLAANLEWIFPLLPGVADPPWLEYVPLLWVLAGLSLLSGCPEDSPGDERNFLGTRPLAAWQYWAAQGLIFTLLLMLPMLVQNAAYLLLSHRPVPDVLRGVLERGAVILGLGLWLVPVAALWTRQERWKADWMMLGIACGSFSALPVLTKLVDPPGRGFFLPYESWAHAGIILAVMLTVLVVMHQLKSLSFAWRLGGAGVSTFIAMVLCLYWPLITHPQGDQNPELVRELAPKLQVTPGLREGTVKALKGEDGFDLYSEVSTETNASGIQVTLRPAASSAIQKGSEVSQAFGRYQTTLNGYGASIHEVDHTLAGFFPAETLLIRQDFHFRPLTDERPNWQVSSGQNVPFGNLKSSFNETLPVQIKTDFTVQWWQREVIADFPCVSNAKQEHADGFRWRVDATQTHVLGGSVPQQGAFTVHLHLDRRTHWQQHENLCFLLHSPQRRVAWLVPDVQATNGARGEHSGWQRSSLTLAWKDVLNHADGEDAKVDPAQLRLLVFRGRELGTSIWTWQSPELKVSKAVPYSGGGNPLSFSSLYKGDTEGMRSRLATFKKPDDASSVAEVCRYLYDVLVLCRRYYVADEEVAREAFMPLVQHHMAQMLMLPENYWPSVYPDTFAQLMAEHLREDQRETVIDLLPEHPRLIEIVLKRGWAEAARRVQPQILAAKRPLNNEHYADLLLAWGDTASYETLLREFRGYGSEFQALVAMPDWRPRLEAMIMAERRRQPIVMPGPSHGLWGIKLAADLGDAAAFDLSLRVMGYGPFSGGGSSSDIPPIPTLIDANGKRIWQSEDEVANTLRFRHRTSVDFDYLPEQLAWKPKP